QQETVVGLFSKDCILPCSFPPGDGEVIHWKKGDKNVHSYYRQSDQMKNQDLDYKSRTYLFHQNIHNGNASLKLSNLTVTDEGLYKCYVGTLETKTEWEVMLYVRVSSYYALEYQKTGSRRMLMCHAFLTYPAPQISWLLGNTSIQETNQEKSRDGVLYSLRSDQTITNTADTYHCHIHLPYKNWTAEWQMEEQLSGVEGGSTTIPCDCSNTIADTEGFSVVWIRDGVILGLAAFNGTFHSSHPRVQVNQSNFSLMLHDLTTQDSGEYLCNISTSDYTKLTVRALQV
ncbi:HHLA2 protein, partial [Tricholaema leucomelas]|nr:HHLA2 protein [Tricholaema leucomelas]